MLHTVDIVLSLIILLRTLCYHKPEGATYRPLVSFVAYLIVVVAGVEFIQLVFFFRVTDLGAVIYKGLLMLVLLKSRGNVVDLFYTRETSSLVFRLLNDTWDDIREKLNRLYHFGNDTQEKRTR